MLCWCALTHKTQATFLRSLSFLRPNVNPHLVTLCHCSLCLKLNCDIRSSVWHLNKTQYFRTIKTCHSDLFLLTSYTWLQVIVSEVEIRLVFLFMTLWKKYIRPNTWIALTIANQSEKVVQARQYRRLDILIYFFLSEYVSSSDLASTFGLSLDRSTKVCSTMAWCLHILPLTLYNLDLI